MTTRKSIKKTVSFQYDVALSFAGENRQYVRKVADSLTKIGVRVFFDEYSTVDMWGKDLYTHLQDLYKNAARYCILFISKQYAKKVWTNHERRSAQARAIKQNSEYILPARFDNTEIPGLLDTIGYIDLRKISPLKLASMIQSKVGTNERRNYFPPTPDLFFKELKVRTKRDKQAAESRARVFFQSLERMTDEERFIIFSIFIHTCPAGLPDDVHMNLDLLRRITEYPRNKIIRILGRLSSLGFTARIDNQYVEDNFHHQSEVLVLEWHDMSVNEDAFGNATLEAEAVITVASEGYCSEHALKKLMRLDLSQLSTATVTQEKH